MDVLDPQTDPVEPARDGEREVALSISGATGDT